MAMDIYDNGTNILLSKSPIDEPDLYASTDLERITEEPIALTEAEIKGVENKDFERKSKQEFHIYSGENLLGSNFTEIKYEINNDADNLYDYDIVLKPEDDVRKSNISKGSFSVVYNFLTQKTDKLKLENISADGTELQLIIDVEKGIVDSKEGLLEIFDDINAGSNAQYVLNFGDNNLAAITNIDFTLNERVGFINDTIPFPTSTFQNKRTRFYPISNQEGYWAEVFIDEEVVDSIPAGATIMADVEDAVPETNTTPSNIVLENEVPKPQSTGESPVMVSAPAPDPTTNPLQVQAPSETRTEVPYTFNFQGLTDPKNAELLNPNSRPIPETTVTTRTTTGENVIVSGRDLGLAPTPTRGQSISTSVQSGQSNQLAQSTMPTTGTSTFKDKLGSRLLLGQSITVNPRYRTTGRGAKFSLGFNENDILEYQIDRDVTGEPVYYIYDNDDDTLGFILRPGIDYFRLLNGKPTFSEVQYYNPLFKDESNFKTITVKLYKPLRGDLQTKPASIDRLVRNSYVEKLLVYPFTKVKVKENFSEPNFKIDMGTYGKSVGTDLKSWNDLLDANLTTSQQIVDKYISSSFTDNINVNYSDFSEFVHYSSAVERVNNFKYKVELIESFDSRIKTLQSVSGSEALTNISQSITRKNNVVSGMDGWERWMYNEPSSSLYTHYSSSAFTFKPWPKVSSQPVQLISVTSSDSINYYNGLIESASYFDSVNDARLTKSLPASIAEDPLNSDYLLFVDMIGHHFDITWSYIKKLTSIHTREEHPFDGMPNELLYDVAKSLGWKLSHGQDRAELWNYALGTDKFGNTLQSGSLASKPFEQYTHEVWRRIVNNIPYLLKTKGSARAVKALISTYGIPQTFLSIREYGGPAIEEERHIWEHERFVYHLRFDGDNYMQVPFDKVNDIDPITYLNRDPNPIDTIELQVQQDHNRDTAILNKDSNFAVIYESISTAQTNKKGNIHFYLSGSSGYKSASISNINVFDKQMGTLIVQRQTSVDDITQDNEYRLMYRRHRKDEISVSHSASIFITGSTESSYNAAWTGSGTLSIGKTLPTTNTPSLWANAQYLSGSIQELRYWANPLKDIVIDEHTLSRESYHGNAETSSYFDLKFRFLPDSRLKNVQSTDSQPSQHPNQRISTVLSGGILSASLYNFESDDLRGVTDEYYTKVPSAGANNIMNNKIRVEPNRLRGMLDVDQRKEKSKFDTAPNDSNQLGVYLSATKMFNEDIYNHTGYFDIDDYIGDPDQREGFTEQNEQLDYLRRQVFKKYSSKNLINTVIDILARYDFSVFEQIRQTVPARVDYNSGILIEPHILERPKAKSKVKVTKTEPMYQVTIEPIDKDPQMFITPLETTMSARPKVQDWEYPTYETEISGGAAPNISMEYPTYNTTISGTASPNVLMTYPTYDNFSSPTIPMLTGSFEAAYLTYNTKLDLTASQQLEGEYPTYDTKLVLTESFSQTAEYPTYDTKLDLTESFNQTAEYPTYNSSIVIDEQFRSASAETLQYTQLLNVFETPKDVTGLYYLYNATLPQITQSIVVTKEDLENKGLITAKLPYQASRYKFDILIPSQSGNVGFGVGWITGSNGSWNYNPLGTTITDKRPAKYARSINYFYSSSLSASLGLSYSSSFSPARVSTDELPLAIDNLRYLGCKMTSDSLTTNSPDTPDGKPVIEIFQADPNVLINTSQTAEEGNLDVDTQTGIATVNIDDLKISEEIRYQRELEYKEEVKQFRREIQRLTSIETARRNEFDLRLQNSEDISNRESARQDEFDIVNNAEVVEKELKQKEVEKERETEKEEVKGEDLDGFKLPPQKRRGR